MHDDLPIEPSAREPYDDDLLDEPKSNWPTVIAIISIIYASLGLMGAVCSVGAPFLMPLMPAMFGGGIPMPTAIVIQSIVLGLLGTGLGILLITGSVALLKRRRIGVRRTKLWAVLRLLLIPIALVSVILTAPAQIDYQRQIQEKQQESFAQNGQQVPAFDMTDELRWTMLIVQTAVITALQAVYPIVLAVYLSRRRITEEVQRWP